MRDFLKGVWAKLKGYRTIVFNAVVGLASFGMAFMPYLLGVDWAKLGLQGTAGALMVFAVNMANIGLRFISTTPVGQKEA